MFMGEVSRPGKTARSPPKFHVGRAGDAFLHGSGATQVYELKRVSLSMRRLIAAAVLALGLAATATAGTPATAQNLGCGAGTLVLNVHYLVQSDVDTCTRGNNWVFDMYNRTGRAWWKAAGGVCAA